MLKYFSWIFMKKIIIISLLFCSVSASFASADWEAFGAVYIDNMSISREGDSVKAWLIRPEFSKSKVANRTYMYEGGYFDAKCKDREMALLMTAWYDKYHQLIKTSVLTPEYIKIKPKTNNEVIFKAICSKQKILPAK